MDDVEDRIYTHQHDLIKARYGEEEADRANYGWGVAERDNGISVATKIYNGAGTILITDAEEPDFEFYDEWRNDAEPKR
jgi:hypothetical protein